MKTLERYGGTDVHRATIGGTNVTFKHGPEGSTEIRFRTYGGPAPRVCIENITTFPNSARSNGEGSRALTSFLTWARAEGYATVTAEGVKDPRAKLFWEKNNFQQDEYLPKRFLFKV